MKQEVIDVEYESERRNYNEKVFKKYNIFIPERYRRRMIQTGLIHKFVMLIDQVNAEEKEEKKKLKKLTLFRRRQFNQLINKIKNENTNKPQNSASTETKAADSEQV
ncbi:unnamed protein product [Rotaria sp. Silwood2]|nr:unnamed protein product [Rotaria sp. Silwood2]